MIWWKPRAWCNIISILPNKKLFQGPVNRPNVNDQLQALCLPQTSSVQQYSHRQHHHCKKNMHWLIGFTFFVYGIKSSNSYLYIHYHHKQWITRYIPADRSLQSWDIRQASLVGTTTALPGPPPKNQFLSNVSLSVYQLYFFQCVNCISFSSSIVFLFHSLLSFQSFVRKIWFDLINICRLKCSSLKSLISNSRDLNWKICIFGS